MYALVERVEDYPKFLQWCSDVDVQRNADSCGMLATLTMNFHGFRQSFTTRNTNIQGQSITMALVSGPFKTLDGGWTFTGLQAGCCKVDLKLHYDFSGHMLEALISPVFEAVAISMVDSFCKRAEEVYG